MTDRERLVKILCEAECQGEENQLTCPERRNGQCKSIRKLEMCQVNSLADHILSDGWIRPPCKVGDTVYVLYPQIKYIEKYYVTGIILGDKNDTIQFKGGSVFTIWDKKYDEFFGKTVFFTLEEAEKARAEREDVNGK